jgi:hypothetical protein
MTLVLIGATPLLAFALYFNLVTFQSKEKKLSLDLFRSCR